jgi:hypothetical protein
MTAELGKTKRDQSLTFVIVIKRLFGAAFAENAKRTDTYTKINFNLLETTNA